MTTPSDAAVLLPPPPRDLDEIALIDSSLTFPTFTTHTAWALGTALRTRLQQGFPQPALVDISLAHGEHCLFRCATHPGTTPDHDAWVRRKRNTVLRFGQSSWFVRHRFGGDEKALARKLGEKAGEYAIHGGGWPVRVQGVEGVVAVIVVSGLKQEEDHGVIVQVVRDYLEELGIEMGEKKKED